MRRLILSLAAVAAIGVGLASANTASAHEFGYYNPAYYGYDGYEGWREHAWRAHQWREWAWRRHLQHEWWHNRGGYGEPGGYWYR